MRAIRPGFSSIFACWVLLAACGCSREDGGADDASSPEAGSGAADGGPPGDSEVSPDGSGDPDAGAESGTDAGGADGGGGCPPSTFGPSCAAVTCQNGTCNQGTCWGPAGTGACDTCNSGWTGVNCDNCDSSHFGASCENTVRCVNGTCAAGTCSGTSGSGHCDVCNADWVGPACDGHACDGPHFGASCENTVTCVNGTCGAGTCSGTSGSGHCDVCTADWVGDNCDQICLPFKIEACYDGPDGTKDVGICHGGTRVCHQSGQHWSPCFEQEKPRAEDLCDNDLDDNCSGSEADEVCAGSSTAAWVDGENGSDTLGNGSFTLPYATLTKARDSGKKLVIVRSDADGTVYREDLTLSSTQTGITFSGWGPTRPTLSGTVSITHCYDCAFENMELAYPDVATYDPDPVATVRGVHNYRSVWRNVRFSAPTGLPGGASLYTTHHGYDNTFVDVAVDNVVLAPGSAQASVTYALLNANDHGTGSQFTRVTLGSVSLSGAAPNTLSIEFIKAWGYCDQQPTGVTAVRNALITGLDMTGMATGTTSFEAIELGCYYTFEEPAGFIVLNNTLADIIASSVTFATLNLTTPVQTWISGNLVGPHTAGTVTGLVSNQAATIDYSNFYAVTTPVSNAAVLGSHMLAVDPKFVGGGDYRLDAGSACINTGDPLLTDGDGTRSDMGAYGGPLAP